MEEKESDNIGDETVSCPVCGKWVKSIFAHLGKSIQCKENISPEDLLNFENIRSLKRKMDKRANAARSRRLNPEKSKEQTRKAAAFYLRWRINFPSIFNCFLISGAGGKGPAPALHFSVFCVSRLLLWCYFFTCLPLLCFPVLL